MKTAGELYVCCRDSPAAVLLPLPSELKPIFPPFEHNHPHTLMSAASAYVGRISTADGLRGLPYRGVRLLSWLNILTVGIWLVAAWPAAGISATSGQSSLRVREEIGEILLVSAPSGEISLDDIYNGSEKFNWKILKSNLSMEPNTDYFLKFRLPNSSEELYVLKSSITPCSAIDSQYLGCYFSIKNRSKIPLHSIDKQRSSIRISKDFYGSEILLRISTGAVPVMAYVRHEIKTLDEEDIDRIERRTLFGGVFGSIIIMIVYNIGMFLLFRRRYIFLYVVYSVSVFYWLAYFSSFIAPWAASIYFLNVACATGTCSTILFSMDILSTRKKYPKKFLIGISLCIFSTVVFGLLCFGFSVLLPVAFVIPAITNLYSTILAIQEAYNGNKPAFPMVLGWTSLFLSGVLVAISYLIPSCPDFIWTVFLAVAFEIATFSFSIGQKLRMSELQFQRENQHAFAEMAKMVYPHQLLKIRGGEALERTMPTVTAQACVLSFDIVGSSKIHHVNAKKFFRNTFTRCNEIISYGYDGQHLKASAYRIKEMGDGFLCSIGYPFESMSDNLANDAVDLAKMFASVLREEAEMLHSETPIACGIGIALDTITGFYPEAGTKEYDLYGQAIVLATRYEGMRKNLFEAEKGRSVLIIQEKVFQSLDPSHRAGFISMDLKELEIVLRDDPAATKLYYQFLDADVAADGKPGAVLEAV